MAATQLPGTPVSATPVSATPHRRRRWMLVAVIVGVLLLAYVLALTWAAQRLETDLQSSIRSLSTDQTDHH